MTQFPEMPPLKDALRAPLRNGTRQPNYLVVGCIYRTIFVIE